MQKKIALVGLIPLLLQSGIASALPHNTNTLPTQIGGSASEPVLVQNAKVTLLASDFGVSGYIAAQLATTDSNPAGTGNTWTNNLCTSAAPHSGMAPTFFIDAAGAQTDNKLQKLLSLLQTAQLTSMQVTITGTSVSGVGNQWTDCAVSNIKHVYLRNTTF